jgi:hypothetical protein
MANAALETGRDGEAAQAIDEYDLDAPPESVLGLRVSVEVTFTYQTLFCSLQIAATNHPPFMLGCGDC